MGKLHQLKIKQLRTDARKLRVIAKHLSEEAAELAREQKRADKEAIKTNFYSKRAKVDNKTVLTPVTAEELSGDGIFGRSEDEMRNAQITYLERR